MIVEGVDYIRPALYPKQHAAIFDKRRISCIEASTKSGKTVGSIAWLVEQALKGRPGQNFWWVAPVSSQADIAFRRMRRALPHDFVTPHIQSKMLLLANETMVWFKSGDHEDSLYGEDVYAAVIDEASRFKAEAWYAVRSTLTATRGRLRIIGNVKGRKNWFYALARRAELGLNDTGYHKITAYDAVDAGVLVSEEIEQAKRDLPEHVFRELYLAEPAADDGNPFGIDAIDACVAPLASGEPVVWGVDLARSVDWTVALGLNNAGATCRLMRFQKPWGETVAVLRESLARTPALVDSTGVGDPIAEELSRTLGAKVEGFKFTSQSKQQLMEGLALAITRREIAFPEQVAIELRQFEFHYSPRGGGVKYSAPDGFHDDQVCALALAQQQRIAGRGTFDDSYRWVG